MYSHVNPKNGEASPLIATDVFEIVLQVSKRLAFCSVSNISSFYPALTLSFSTARGAIGQRDYLQSRF
jgi:hypothetical protein